MTENKALPEEYDDGSSLEKELEKLDKNDLEYASKREKVLEKLKAFKEKIKLLEEQIRQQRQDLSDAIKDMRSKASLNPKDSVLQDLITEASQDKAFLTRAATEVLSLKGNWNIEMDKLTASKNFNMPISLTAITDAEIKPLPSSEITHKKEKSKESHQEVKEDHQPKKEKSASKIAAQILRLRLQETNSRPQPRKVVNERSRT